MDEKEYIINKFKYEEISKYGDLIPIKDFIKYVKKGVLKDYDGYGLLVYNNKMVGNSHTDCEGKEFKIDNKWYNMVGTEKIFKNDIKVIWFNV